MNFWYQSRANEIFLDLDSRRAINRAMNVLRLAMKDNSKSPRLAIREIYIYPTQTDGHAHVVIQLKQSLPVVQRLAWSAWLGNDRLRLAYVLMRSDVIESALGLYNRIGDLLVSRQQYHRTPDAFCECNGKHKDPTVTEDCPAMTHLLNGHRSADYFYRTGKTQPAGNIRIPWGKVSKTQIREWTNGKREKREK